jgi:hypothetical protein
MKDILIIFSKLPEITADNKLGLDFTSVMLEEFNSYLAPVGILIKLLNETNLLL